jgi:hypothetical protein
MILQRKIKGAGIEIMMVIQQDLVQQKILLLREVTK